MGSLGFQEILLILLIVLIVFGAGNLPKIGRGLGEGISNFRQAMKNGEKKSEDEKKQG